MNLNNLFSSKLLKIVFPILGFFIILLLVFKLGVFVGYKKAQLSYYWGENYHRNFAGPRRGFWGDLKYSLNDKGDFINAHGVFGSIIKIDGNVLVIKDREAVEKIVFVSEATLIKKGREVIKFSDLKLDDKVVIIGSPNEQGQIEAKFIRVFDKEIFGGFFFRHFD